MQPWSPAGIKHRAFGDALFPLLAGAAIADDDAMNEANPGEAVSIGKWQPLLQPYFPTWCNTLKLHQVEAKTGTYVFKVSLPGMWRQIAISAGATLDALAAAILRSVRFDFDHLYEFTYRDRFGATVQAVHPAIEEGPFADNIRIGTLPIEPGQAMEFMYDYGDSWRFDVKLESIDPASKPPRTPKVLDKYGKAPPQYPNWDE